MSSNSLEQLEFLQRASMAANGASARIALESVHSELLGRGSRSSSQSIDFFLAALQVLRKLRGTGNATLRIQCLHKCAVFFFQHGQSAAALESADLLEALAQQCRAFQTIRQARSIKGVVYADLGDISEALTHHSGALEVAREMGDTENESVALNNLGIAFNYAGLYRDAIACFHRVIACAHKGWKLPVEKKALSNLAQSYLGLGDLSLALETIQRSLAERAPPLDAVGRMDLTVCEFTYVQVALEMNDGALARRHADSCAAHGFAANSIRCKIMADIAHGRCEVRDGNTRSGMAILEQALEDSRDLDSSRLDALVALTRAYDESGEPAAALRCMDELLVHMRKKRAAGLEAQMANASMVGSVEHDAYRDLRDLEYRHARLRAEVAEREVLASRFEMIERLAATADLREDSSGQHGYRVGALSSLLAAEIGLGPETAKAIELAARLHDFGKTAIPEHILGSSQVLKEAERRMMSLHTVIGAELLAKSAVPQLKMAEDIARHHHEFWDGSGYPDKLAGKNIPIYARIVALADVLDALTHGRPYAEPWSLDRALQEIRARRGTQFDPTLTDRFVAMVERLCMEHADLDAYLSRAGVQSPFLQARTRIRTLFDEARNQTLEQLLH